MIRIVLNTPAKGGNGPPLKYGNGCRSGSSKVPSLITLLLEEVVRLVQPEKLPVSKSPFAIRLPNPDFQDSVTFIGWLMARFAGPGVKGASGVSSSWTITEALPSVQPAARAVMVTN